MAVIRSREAYRSGAVPSSRGGRGVSGARQGILDGQGGAVEAVDSDQWVADGELRCTGDLMVECEVGDFGEQQWRKWSSMVALVGARGSGDGW